MTNHFNQLSEAQAELLAWLSEELGEAIQAIGKINRHGYESYNPFVEAGLSNRVHLEKELGHVFLVIQRLCAAKDLDFDRIEHFAKAKNETVGQFLHHQGDVTSRSGLNKDESLLRIQVGGLSCYGGEL
jgi:NTP pyrophosphatase (non-canonical NTP hydrolase)